MQLEVMLPETSQKDTNPIFSYLHLKEDKNCMTVLSFGILLYILLCDSPVNDNLLFFPH